MVLGRHELSVSELVEVLGQPQSTVSRHLKVLREARLIRDRREANTVLYSVDTPPKRVGMAAGTNGVPLVSRVLEWVAEEPMPAGLARRLERVLSRRRQMSRKFFARVGRQWDSLREEAFGDQFHLEAFVSLLPRHWVVADVGTGTGYLLPTLAAHFHRVVAVELVERMLEVAEQRVVQQDLRNVTLQRGDVTRLPIRRASVDLAIAMLVLHHVEVPQDAVRELGRIVRPAGRVLIVEQTVHEHESFRDRMQDRWWGLDPNRIVSWLTVAGFERANAHVLCNIERAADAPDLFVVTGIKGAIAESN